MTPKEKALELCDAFYQYLPLEHNVITTEGDLSWEYDGWKNAKQCALKAVNEISKCTKYEKQKFENDRFSEDYWEEVKQEIEKL